MFKPIITRLAGVAHYQETVSKFGVRDVGGYALIREPDNPHDPNAIQAVLVGIGVLGYLPRQIAEQLAPLIDSGRRFFADFVSRNQSPNHNLVGVTVRIVETTP